MLTLHRLIKHKNSNIPSLSLLHTTPHSDPPEQIRHIPTRRNQYTAYYDDLVAKAGEARDFPRLRHLLIERINNKCYNSKDTFNFVTKTQNSISNLDDIFDCLASLPSGTPRRSAFDCFVKRLCILGLLDHALQVLDKMRQRKLELNSYTYNPVIQSLIKNRPVKEAVKVLEGMKNNGVEPDTTSYNYLLTAYCMRRDVGSAVGVLERMTKGDARTYDAMVIGTCRVGKVEGAVAIVRAAVDDGVTLMHCTYEHVIKALLDAGYYEQGLKFVLCFAGRVKKLDDVNFDFLGKCLIELKRFDEAKMVVDEMKKRGLFMSEKVKEFWVLHGSKETLCSYTNKTISQ
ncbi:hypothetical protein RND81_08G032200 [Saponaria officinalis]|uniref:Pentatricopeptide repeat-containing protein n=1 Tax=Saponaria officinalis TaxID=3572 RepID=A0AAW1J3C0_SAPOF